MSQKTKTLSLQQEQTLRTDFQSWLRAFPSKADLDETFSSLPLQLQDYICSYWPLWARDQQLPDRTDWTNWLLLGGRGAGKTRAGAEWIRGVALGDPFFVKNPVERIALVGETYADVREVMIEGPSGLLSIHANDERPIWISSRRRLEWPNGSIAQMFSSEDPDALRGPQFGAAWSDAKTIWGSLVAIGAAVASALGMDIQQADQEALSAALLQMTTVVGSLIAIFGRLSASTRIE